MKPSLAFAGRTLAAATLSAALGVALFGTHIETALDDVAHRRDVTQSLQTLTGLDPKVTAALAKAYPDELDPDDHLRALTSTATRRGLLVTEGTVSDLGNRTLSTDAGTLTLHQHEFTLRLQGEPSAVLTWLEVLDNVPITHEITSVRTTADGATVRLSVHTQKSPL